MKKGFAIELSENLELLSSFTIRATAPGEGYVKISRDGQVLRTIAVIVED